MSEVRPGDRVTRTCVTLTGLNAKLPMRLTGTVVWVHPAGRYHVVDFPGGSAPLRECFQGTSRVEPPVVWDE